jgi:hypothetical protein
MHNAKLWVAGRTPALCGSNLKPWGSTSHYLSCDDYAGSNPVLDTLFLFGRVSMSGSSSGLGHRPFTAGTRVRIPYLTPTFFYEGIKHVAFVPRRCK